MAWGTIASKADVLNRIRSADVNADVCVEFSPTVWTDVSAAVCAVVRAATWLVVKAPICVEVMVPTAVGARAAKLCVLSKDRPVDVSDVI